MNKLMIECVAAAIADSLNESLDPMAARTDIYFTPDDRDRVAARCAINAIRRWDEQQQHKQSNTCLKCNDSGYVDYMRESEGGNICLASKPCDCQSKTTEAKE